MICISVTPTSRRLAKADLLNAAHRADMIELCLDHLVKEPDVGDMLEGVNKPVIVSCRRKEDGGHWQGDEEQRLQLLRKAIVAGPAYIELELDVAGDVPRFGETKRVVSYTSLHKPLSGVDDVFLEASNAKADVVKFTWPTPTLDAAWPLLVEVTKKRELPVVGQGLGRAGRTFSILAQKFGSPWIYAALEPGMEAHPGQPNVWELEETYSWDEIDRKTRLVGVVGFGSSDEKTVKIFNAGFRALGKNIRCLPLALGRIDKLAKMLDTLKINVLLVSPLFAEDVLEFADHAEEAAVEAGFADLVVKQSDGWHAFNTLWRNALKAIESTLGVQDDGSRPLDRRNVLLIGANATARALAWGVKRRNGVLSVTDPDDEEARKFAQRFDVRMVPFASVYDTLADVVAFTDPHIVVGHKRAELNPGYLKPAMTVFDACKLPDETEFLREARERGCRVVSPRDVFVDQVAARFKAITGEELPPDALAAGLG